MADADGGRRCHGGTPVCGEPILINLSVWSDLGSLRELCSGARTPPSCGVGASGSSASSGWTRRSGGWRPDTGRRSPRRWTPGAAPAPWADAVAFSFAQPFGPDGRPSSETMCLRTTPVPQREGGRMSKERPAFAAQWIGIGVALARPWAWRSATSPSAREPVSRSVWCWPSRSARRSLPDRVIRGGPVPLIPSPSSSAASPRTSPTGTSPAAAIQPGSSCPTAGG